MADFPAFIASHHLGLAYLKIELELNSLDWNGNELEHKLELEDMKLTNNK